MRREIIDLRNAALLGVISVSLFAIGYHRANPFFYSLSALSLYLATLSCNDRVRVVPPLVFAPLLLMLPSSEQFHYFRILLASALMAVIPGVRNSSAPAVIGVLAAMALLTTGQRELAELAAMEFVASPLVLLLVWSQLLHKLVGRTTFSVPVRSIVTTVALFLISVSLLIGVVGAQRLANDTLQSYLGNISNLNWVVSATILLIAISNILGLVIHSSVRDFLELCADLENPDKRSLRILSKNQPVREFNLLLNRFRISYDDLSSKAKETQYSLKELTEHAAAREREISERELSFANMERLYDCSPLGFIAISGSGAVLAANKRFFSFMRFPEQQLISRHFTTIASDKPWREDFVNFLDSCVEAAKDLDQYDQRRSFIPLPLGRYLAISALTAKSEDLGIVETRPSELLAASNIVVCVFIEEKDDLRELQLRNQNPAVLEVAGAQAIEIISEIKQNLESVLRNTADGLALAKNIKPTARQGIDAELALAIKEVDRISVRSQKLVDDYLNSVKPAKGPLVTVDIALILRQGLAQLYELLGLSENKFFEVQEDNPVPILLQATPTELYRFVAMFFSYVESVAPRAGELHFSAALEKIGSGTAHFIPGSTAGDYVRLVIEQPVQTITTNMIQESIRSVDLQTLERGQVDATLSMLSLATSRLNGFLSLQTSALKGTQVTIYIPETPESVRPSARFIRKHKESSEKKELRVLVVTDEQDNFSDLRQSLIDIGCDVRFERPGTLLTQTDDLLSFDGTGFGDSPGSNGGSVQLALDPSTFDALIFCVSDTSDTNALIVERFASTSFAVPSIVVDKRTAEESPIILADWTHVKFPCPPQQLKVALGG